VAGKHDAKVMANKAFAIVRLDQRKSVIARGTIPLCEIFRFGLNEDANGGNEH
jgi:hypothetical protein